MSVPAADSLNGCLKLFSNPSDLVRSKQPRKTQIPECAEKAHLRFRQLHGIPPIGADWP
jgi:hypothetical protein